MSIDHALDTDPDLIESVCDSLGFPPELAHLVPVVFAHCKGLGGLASPVVSLLKRIPVTRGATIIDLACGKGEITLAIARSFDAHVRGVDACGALLRDARTMARKRDLHRRVRFRKSDVLGLPPSRHDIAIMIGWLGIEHAPEVLRAHVGRHGYYIFDDAIVADSRTNARRVVRERVCALGDSLVASRCLNASTISSLTLRDCAAVGRGVAQALEMSPANKPRLRRWFANFQRHAANISSSHVIGYWLCRKDS